MLDGMEIVLRYAASCWIGVLALGCGAPVEEVPTRSSTPPNIVLIVADDLGWTDVVANDPLDRSFYDTPNLDRLAATSVRFTQAYANAPNCAPARAALATGLRYPGQPIYTVGSGARGKAEARKLVPVQNRTSLPTRYATLAERMRARGYATWFVGKWHLGHPGESGPLEHGFDVNVAGNHTGTPKSYFSPFLNPELSDGPDGEYLTPRLTDEACALIESHTDAPFFLQLSYYTVHGPLKVPAPDVEPFRMKDADRGHRNAKYAAMIANLDRGVGQVLDVLDRAGLADNTLVVFTSDNGGVGGYEAEGLGGRDVTTQAPLRGGKGMLYEGGIRVPLFLRHPGRLEAGTVVEEPVTHVDLLPTFCGVSGTPLVGVGHHGQDLAHLWNGRGLGERNLVWYFPGYLERGKKGFRTTPAIALRRGNYKLLHFFEDERSELYDLGADVGETHDLSKEQPERAHAMLEDVWMWLDESKAPFPTPK